jgi:ribulose-phosphate 3-epimerase
MSMRPLIAPSILSADFGRLRDEVRAVAEAGADWIHMDVMDGHFVPNLTFGPAIVRAVRDACTLPFDVHLMIDDPDTYAPQFRDAGADSITVHVEATRHLHRSLQVVRATGARVGVSLNPHTPLSSIENVLEDVDLVLLMTVNPGFGGQSFIRNVLPKIRALREIVQRRALQIDIEIDGGVNDRTVSESTAAGANVLVAGSAVFGAKSYREAIAAIRAGGTEGLARGFSPVGA